MLLGLQAITAEGANCVGSRKVYVPALIILAILHGHDFNPAYSTAFESHLPLELVDYHVSNSSESPASRLDLTDIVWNYPEPFPCVRLLDPRGIDSNDTLTDTPTT